MTTDCLTPTEQNALYELALMPTGGHLTDPCYGARRAVKDAALAVLALGEGSDART